MFDKKITPGTLFALLLSLLTIVSQADAAVPFKAAGTSTGSWLALGNGAFKYTGAATNDASKVTSFIVSGASLEGEPLAVIINMAIPGHDGQRIALVGLNGRVFVDDLDLGVSGDSNYSVHFTKIDESIRGTLAVIDLSDGARVDNYFNIGVDNDGEISFCEGAHNVFTTDKFHDQKYTTIDASNGGEGFTLKVDDGVFTAIGGLKDGFNVKVTPGNNVGERLKFKTDGGRGTITVGEKVFNVSGEKEFTVSLDGV